MNRLAFTDESEARVMPNLRIRDTGHATHVLLLSGTTLKEPGIPSVSLHGQAPRPEDKGGRVRSGGCEEGTSHQKGITLSKPVGFPV